MEANPVLFRDLTYIFVAAIVGGLVAWRLRLPLLIGFVFGGIVVSPFTPGPHLSNLHTFEVFAEVGVDRSGIFDSGSDAREVGCDLRRANGDFMHGGHRGRCGQARRMDN